MRENSKAEGQRWLDQAKAGLKWTRYLFKEGAYYLVCFLAQQTAEKALKAFLALPFLTGKRQGPVGCGRAEHAHNPPDPGLIPLKAEDPLLFMLRVKRSSSAILYVN